MSNTIIKVENLSKQYRLGKIGTGSLAHDINRWWHRMRGNEDPYLKIGDSNDRTSKGNSEYVWSLRDINFEIKQGDAVGIIGRNGAGKSTLLKILSRTTAPTSGSIKIKGRVASLLEVGTGFHPELTGRENIFLNGAILGMTKAEIKSKFDEIVDFAGVERYIDTPVKRYSSGMYVRLAFGVAAHLEPEILIVDEVLAVGDAEFQKKALGKMQDVSSNDGRTVLFVSHNMASINSLTNKCIYLKNGLLVNYDDTSAIIDEYVKDSDEKFKENNIKYFRRDNRCNESKIKIQSISCNGINNEIRSLKWDEDIYVTLNFEIDDFEEKAVAVNFFLRNQEGVLVFSSSSLDYNFSKTVSSEETSLSFILKQPSLSGSQYFIDIGINEISNNNVIDVIKEYPLFRINDEACYEHWNNRLRPTILKPNIVWD